jgi:hypothetical protein
MKEGGNVMPILMRNMGREVIVMGRDGRMQRGFIDGVDPRRGMFFRDGFRRRRFIPFFLIAAIFLSRGRRRIF